MATFNISVEGIAGPPFLTKYTTANTSCATIYEIYVNASTSDEIEFTITNGGYTSYTCQLNTGSGYSTMSNTSFTFTYGTSAIIKISMLNTAVAESIDITVNGSNNTLTIDEDITCNRVSTGIVC